MIKKQLALLMMLGMGGGCAYGMDYLLTHNPNFEVSDSQRNMVSTAIQSTINHVGDQVFNVIPQEADNIINEHGIENVSASLIVGKTFQFAVSHKIASSFVSPTNIPSFLVYLPLAYTVQVTQETTPSLRHMTMNIGLAMVYSAKGIHNFLKPTNGSVVPR